MNSPSQAAARLGWAALLVMAVAATWPFWADLPLRPFETDDVIWVARSATDQPGWAQWLVLKPHFIGYRPLTAISFTVDWWLSGGAFNAPLYHATDLALYAGTGLLLYPLFRALFPELPRWGGVLAVLVFMLHPAGGEVVPWFSRRSYVMATGASVLAIWFGARGRPVAASAAMAAGMLCNEVAFLVAPVLLVQGVQRDGWGSLRRAALVVVATASLVFLLRYGIVGKIGGYSVISHSSERMVGVLSEAVHYLFTPTLSPRASTPVWLGLALAAAGFYLARSVRLPGARVAWVWLVASLMLIGATQTWFFRLAYPVVAPLAIVVAAVAASTRSWMLAIPQLLFLGWVTSQSPVVRGVAPEAIAARREADARLAKLEVALAQVSGGADVLLVSPYRTQTDGNPYWKSGNRWKSKYLPLWGNFVTRHTTVKVHSLALVRVREKRRQLLPWFDPGPPALVFPRRTEVYLWPARSEDHRVLKTDEVLPLDTMNLTPDRAVWLYYVDPFPGGLVPLRAEGG